MQQTRADEPPPVRSSPSVYQIGRRVTKQPLVQAHQLKAHLSLLRACKVLHTTVETSISSPDPDDGAAQWKGPPSLGPVQRWAYTVGLAVER